MAKRKTPKSEKIVDLKPKAEKITIEQLQKVQGIVNQINRAQLDLGMLETRKHNMLHNIATIQDQLTIMQGEFEKEYGTFDVNIQDGTINYKKDVEADKKD
jgi:hypothetical protein|tara:strand:- start:688 stop:990 length:303 start_codon:yes stop_codon:yes gene_type:complete